jgi:hypothetical protein
VLIFLHIPKCAGTGLYSALASRFRRPAYVNGDLPREEFDGHDFIGGHMHYAHLRTIGLGDNPIITLIRHPVDRFLSAVRYARALPEDPPPQTGVYYMRRMTVGEMARSDRPEIKSDLYMISGMLATGDGEDTCASALETLRSRLAGWGIVERMDESVERIAQAADLPDLDVGVVHESPFGAAAQVASEIDDDALEALTGRLDAEIQLYQKAVDLFERG